LGCAPVFVCGQVPVIVHVYVMTNACTRIVYFSLIYHACDELILLLYAIRGRSFVIVSLRAPYLASGPFQLSGFLLGLRALSASGLLHSTVD